jgi:signal transduction histidine kinase
MAQGRVVRRVIAVPPGWRGGGKGLRMPDLIRASGMGMPPHRRRCAMLAAFGVSRAAATLVCLSREAAAQGDPMALGLAYVDALKSIDQHELAGLALFIGVLFFAVVSSVLLVRTYDRLGAQRTRTDAEAAALAREIDRLYDIILSEPQVVVAWNNAVPEIIGDPAIIAPELTVDHVLTFAAWLRPEQALHLETHVDRLLGRGESFAISLTTASGRYLTAEGRAIGGSAVLKLADVSGVKRDLADLVHHHQQLQGEAGALRAVIEALPAPAWVRDGSGRIAFVNSAYARAVEAPDATSAVAAGRELLDSATRADLERGRADGVPVMRRAAVIVAGARRIFDVTDLPVAGGSAGFGLDASEVETLRAEIARTVLAHRRTLDQLTTAVAMFGADHKLAFYNSAYRTLWDIDPGFLDETPTDSAVLDRLRAARRLPEQQDFRSWKAQLHEAYRATEPRESEWHLPDLRTLRVVTTPNPDGGVTYLFDDVTERLNLERRFDALIRVQRETLDNLSEAVAVFGSDGRVRLFNPVFAKMWGLAPDTLEQRPHIEAVIASCRAFHAGEATWQTLHTAVTALEDRTPKTLRIERTDGAVIDCRTVPLPDGATLVTFHDITDSVHVERVLTERNEALVAADAIKIDFVQHVSYELRSPLTNIIGFAHFLDDPVTGPLTEKQREYLGYITASSNALLAIINNILDLASIGAGAMRLDLEPVDIRATMHAAAEGVQDRLVKNNITLDIKAPPDIGSFVADERRVRQILFNLLANAVGFSPPGETVALTALRAADAVIFAVSDHGPGISSEIKDKVFDWFESGTSGTGHRGAGIGLSIVRSFVELHGGKVSIESVPGQGTTVVCIFPVAAAASLSAAE